MSKETFVPELFTPPRQARLGQYELHPLVPPDVEVDCAAVNANIELIRRTRGGTWPKGPISVEEDRGDLEEHQRQFGAKEAFAYVIGDSGGRYLGCLYIYPPNHPFDDTDKTNMPLDADAAVSFWVTQEAYDAGVYGELFPLVEGWLRAVWSFHRPYITNQEKGAN